MIVFDEAHAMSNAAGSEGSRGKVKGSEQGIAGVRLQNLLPRARVLYASATGASDVNNLAYATRLGLWGPETAFANREAFVADIRDGGIAAMELVARDLKSLGLYTARALSFAGVEYEILEHRLTEDQIAVYDAYVEAWAIRRGAARRNPPFDKLRTGSSTALRPVCVSSHGFLSSQAGGPVRAAPLWSPVAAPVPPGPCVVLGSAWRQRWDRSCRFGRAARAESARDARTPRREQGARSRAPRFTTR